MSERETCPCCGSWIFWIDGVCDSPLCEDAGEPLRPVVTRTIVTELGSEWTGERYPYGPRANRY